MQLQHLKTFVRVVDTGGVTRAAEQLSLTQPAVTRQLASLEADVGVQLLWRRRRQLRLTPAGELLYSYARRINSLADEAWQAVHNLHQAGQGEVSLGAVSTLGLTVLPRILAHFSARYAGVKVRVQMGEIQDNVDRVLRGDLELALVTMPVAHPQIVSLPLFRDPVRLVAAPTTAARLPVRLTAHDLAGLDLISYQAPSRFRSFVDGMLEQYGVLPRVLMEFNSHEAIKSMVELGLGVAWMPESVVEEDLQSGRLQTLNVDGMEEMARVTSLILPAHGHSTPSLQFLLASFIELFAVDPRELPLWVQPAAIPSSPPSGGPPTKPT